MARVLVTNAQRGNAVAIVRSLGRAGHWVAAADVSPKAIGFASRYVAERIVHPDPYADPEAMVDCIVGAVDRWGVDLVIPVTDELLLPLANARDRLGRGVLAAPDLDVLAGTTDKARTLDHAITLGIPVPAGAVVRTVEEALAAAGDLGWPVVLKPRSSRRYGGDGSVERFRVTYAIDAGDLRRRMADLEGRTEVLLQRHVPGEGHGVELLLHEGRPLAAFQHRRLREVPVSGGPSSLREAIALDPQLLEWSSALLSGLGWTGLAMVEFKVGAGGPALMEVNGRIWGSLPLAVRAGMDFPAKLVDLYLDGPPPPGPIDTTYRVGVRSRDLERELVWIGGALRNRPHYSFLPAPTRLDGMRVAAGLLRPGGYDVLSRHDLRPGLAEIRYLVRKLRGKVGSDA